MADLFPAPLRVPFIDERTKQPSHIWIEWIRAAALRMNAGTTTTGTPNGIASYNSSGALENSGYTVKATDIASTTLWAASKINNGTLGAVNNLGSLTGAKTLTASNGAYQYGTSTGNTTWTFSGTFISGVTTRVTLELTNGGAFTQTWPASVKWPGGVEPTWTAAGVDILDFVTRDGGTTWHGVATSLDSK